MYLLLRISSYLSTAFAFFALYLLHSYPQWLQSTIGSMSLQGIMVGSTIFLLSYLGLLIFIGAGHPLMSRIRFFPFLLLLWVSGLSIFFFTEDISVLWGLIILLPLCSWIWVENLFLFWQRPASYQAYALQKLGNYLYLFVIFLFTTAVIGLQILVQIPFWMSLLISTIGYFFIQLDLFSLHKLSFKDAVIFSCFGTILSLQLLLILNLLPTHFFLYGLIMLLFYYVWNELVLQLFKKRKQEEVKLLTQLVTATLGAVLAFFTTYFLR